MGSNLSTAPLDHSDHIGCVVLARARARIRWAATSPLHHWITLIIEVVLCWLEPGLGLDGQQLVHCTTGPL